jgi:hypothetical protein
MLCNRRLSSRGEVIGHSAEAGSVYKRVTLAPSTRS